MKPFAAFTLIELLVAITVLTLLLLMITQLVNSATIITTGSSKHMDADSEARLLLDRMALDFEKIVRRRDVDYYFQKSDGNDQLAFYTEATGYYPAGVTEQTPKSGISLAGYRINDNYQLERLSKSLIWNGVTSSTTGASKLTDTDLPMVFLPKTLTAAWPKIQDGSDPDYQIIAEQVYRLEYCFLLRPYVDANGKSQPAIYSENCWDARQAHDSAEGLRDVSAVVITIAILDNRSRLLAAGGLTNAASMLPDVKGSSIPETPLMLWQNKINSGSLGLPAVAASQIRIYQRYLYLSPTL